MTITVNGDSIDYTLENEKNAGDILKGLSSWLEESGMLIGSLEINKESRLLNDAEWKIFPIESIEYFSIEALSLREGRIRQLETARDYFILLEDSIQSENEIALEELENGFIDLKQVLPHLLNEGPYPSVLPHLEDTFKKGFKTPESMKAIEAAQMASLLENRRKEASSPETEAASAATALAEMAESLDEVAVQLQTGQDKTAMATIIRLTEILQIFMRSLGWMESNGSIEKIISDMNSILSELEEALKVGDTVLIGDLLEYEIKPRLVELPAGLDTTGES